MDVGVDLGGVTVLDGIDLNVAEGEMLVLVGPNGAGKSTLLGALSGEIGLRHGEVLYGQRPVAGIRHTELARLRSVLTQENGVSFPFLVSEVVAMGRSPWARTVEGRDDISAVAAAMEAADITHLAGRRYTQLSGGEKARVSLARVLAQATPVVFLDEPTASLDLRHQEDVMRIGRRMADEGRTVVVVLHDLSLASAYADRLALISGGRLEALGSPTEVLTAERVERVYGLPVVLHEVAGRPVVVPRRA
ncbi:MAG: heme ABC transporter ATP-binding protein [Actinobacteria bacterium]|nr:heme ABC transporter ATP-binding protein [Actinomycetota bacterium]